MATSKCKANREKAPLFVVGSEKYEPVRIDLKGCFTHLALNHEYYAD